MPGGDASYLVPARPASGPLRAERAAVNANILTSDPERFALANELHSRPFPELRAPCRAIFVAVQPEQGAERDLAADHAHLEALLARHGGARPSPEARHYTGELGRGWLKWESHTEFVTYTLFTPGVAQTPFSGETISMFPADWLAGLGGRIVAAAMVRVERADSPEAAEALFEERLSRHFAQESLSVGFVADDEALVASDFRLHEDGLARIAVVTTTGGGDGVDGRRLGRVVQRLLEIESYKCFALLSLPIARRIANRVTELDRRLAGLKGAAFEGAEGARETLEALTGLAAEVETLSTESAFRFGAAGAYEAIVNDRIAILRERRIAGRQLYSEFMMRRFEPAMRTCRSAERRLKELSDRVARASALLSTRVQVAVEAQNQDLLESMDRRAALQLRLQQTVEGLSVVAISYYAVSLAEYLLGPIALRAGIDKPVLTAIIAVPVIGAVWWMVRRIRRRSEQARDEKTR